MKPNRRNWIKQLSLAIVGLQAAHLNTFATTGSKASPANDSSEIKNLKTNMENNIKPGAFSISLNVKDLAVSKQFYEQLGFTAFGGSMDKNYLIMKNGNALIGLFHGMFSNTILTFNPGWDENANKVPAFDDVRKIQQQMKASGVKLLSEADENTTGPASFMMTDPDGNTILFDQHV